MRPTGRALAAVATAVVATKGAQAFVVPSGASCSSSLRAGAASQQQQQQPYTCSATNNRRSRRAPPPLAAAAAAARGAEEDDDHCPPADVAREGKGRWAGARRSLARGATSLAAFTVGATALSGLSADVQHRVNSRDGAAVVVSMPAATESAEASVFKPFEKRTVEEKLANLPAFMVTNKKGSPYLSPTEPGEPQVCARSARNEQRRSERCRIMFGAEVEHMIVIDIGLAGVVWACAAATRLTNRSVDLFPCYSHNSARPTQRWTVAHLNCCTAVLLCSSSSGCVVNNARLAQSSR